MPSDHNSFSNGLLVKPAAFKTAAAGCRLSSQQPAAAGFNPPASTIWQAAGWRLSRPQPPAFSLEPPAFSMEKPPAFSLEPPAFSLEPPADSPQYAGFEIFLVLVSATGFQIMQWKYDWECNGIYIWLCEWWLLAMLYLCHDSKSCSWMVKSHATSCDYHGGVWLSSCVLHLRGKSSIVMQASSKQCSWVHIAEQVCYMYCTYIHCQPAVKCREGGNT